MFGLPLFFASTHTRTGPAQWLSEFVATFGLLSVIWGVTRPRPDKAQSLPLTAPIVVGTYITAAYWFTASTSFANPPSPSPVPPQTPSPESGQPTHPLSSPLNSQEHSPPPQSSVGSTPLCQPQPKTSSLPTKTMDDGLFKFSNFAKI
jgi:hypothetical protein